MIHHKTVVAFVLNKACFKHFVSSVFYFFCKKTGFSLSRGVPKLLEFFSKLALAVVVVVVGLFGGNERHGNYVVYRL